MSAEMTVSAARDDIGPVTNRAEYGGEITYLTKHGRRCSAVVSADAAELLEELEDLADLKSVRDALAAFEAGEDEAVPFVRQTPRNA